MPVEQPSAKLLIDPVKSIADSILRDLDHQGLSVRDQQALKIAALRKLIFYACCFQSKRRATAGYRSTVRRFYIRHDNACTDNSITADSGDRDRAAVIAFIEQ